MRVVYVFCFNGSAVFYYTMYSADGTLDRFI